MLTTCKGSYEQKFLEVAMGYVPGKPIMKVLSFPISVRGYLNKGSAFDCG